MVTTKKQERSRKVVTDKGLERFLPASVQKSYFMLSDAERAILNTALRKYQPGQSKPILVGGKNLLKPALRLMRNYRLVIEEIKDSQAITNYTRWVDAVQVREAEVYQVINSRHDDELSKIRGVLDMILVTVNVPLNWAAYFHCLAPKGVLHFVGAVLEPVPVTPPTLIFGQKSVSGTPVGSASNTRRMIEFCARHKIAPVIETFPMSQANEALEHLKAGKARYRIVLENDLT